MIASLRGCACRRRLSRIIHIPGACWDLGDIGGTGTGLHAVVYSLDRFIDAFTTRLGRAAWRQLLEQ